MFTKLRVAFTSADTKRAKNTVKPSVFFVLLGSARIKAARKMLMKLAPQASVFLVDLGHEKYLVYIPSQRFQSNKFLG